MTKQKKPFFIFNPKSYLYGNELLELALIADKLAEQIDIDIFVTVPFADITNITNNTSNVIVTAQHIDGIKPGRGMGHVLPEAVYAAGARATFLNHAERSLTMSELIKAVNRAHALNMKTILCADSILEAKMLTYLEPDIILCEPTELIGTGKTSDSKYINDTNQAIKSIDNNILVMQAAGISTPSDVYRTIKLGADGTGCTSGIICADDPKKMLTDMITAVYQAHKDWRQN